MNRTLTFSFVLQFLSKCNTQEIFTVLDKSVLKEKFSLDANGVYVPLEWGGAKTPSTKSEGQKRRDLKDAYGG